MNSGPILKLLLLLSFFPQPSWNTKNGHSEPRTIRGKVFRSDSRKPISNSYILFASETAPDRAHFDTRTSEKGQFVLKNIQPGTYTVSIYAWFRDKSDVPCRNSRKGHTADGGDVTVQWQRKSGAFMEIVTLKSVSIGAGPQEIENFDLRCQ